MNFSTSATKNSLPKSLVYFLAHPDHTPEKRKHTDIWVWQEGKHLVIEQT